MSIKVTFTLSFKKKKAIDLKPMYVAFIPDQIRYEGKWFEKTRACLDLDTGEQTKIYYRQI